MTSLSEKEHTPVAWSTWHEIDFITRSLGGTHKESRLMNRKVLLQRYINSLKLRTEWGGINKDRVLLAAKSQLDAMTRSNAA